MPRLFRSGEARRRELLSAYIDGRVTARERAEVERLLESSQEAREEMESLRATVQLLRQMPAAQPRRSFALTPEMLQRGAPPRPWLRAALPLATAMATLFLTFSLVGGALDLFRQPPRPAPGGALETPAAPATLAPAAPAPQALAASADSREGAAADTATRVAWAPAAALPDGGAQGQPLESGRRFPWLALEVGAGAVTGMIAFLALWLRRTSRAGA